MFKHLEDVGMCYLSHMLLAIFNSFRLFLASIALFSHALLPFLFVRTASSIMSVVFNSLPNHGSRILVRFNTKWREDKNLRQWRVLVDGQEKLASKVLIKTKVETIEEEVSGEQKFHFLCFGNVKWKGEEAEII